MRRAIRILQTHITLILIQILHFIKMVLVGIFRVLNKFFSVIVHYFIRTLFYRGYRLSIVLKRVTNFLIPHKEISNKSEFQKTHHNRVYFIIVSIISAIVIYTNVYGERIPPEEYSKGSILYRVYAEPNLFTETTVSSQYVKDVSYLDGVMRPSFSSYDFSDELTLPTAHDDTALVKINIPTGANQSNRDSIITYTIADGDTVSTIARAYGLSVNSIIWNNDIGNSGVIRPGQKIKIVPYDGVLYTIKKNDTLAKLATTYQSNVDLIIDKNKLLDSSDIRIGEEIIIPNGVKPLVVVARQSSTGRDVIDKILYPSADGNTTTRLLWPLPTHRITQYFGFRHTGLDIADKTGTPIYAAEAGKVERVLYQRTGYGYHIIINHGGDLKTLYGHASKIFVEVGQTVARGDVIALVGSTGRSTGPHCHFEVRVSGKRVNPLSYVK